MQALIGFFLPLILMMGIFYFILIRPQNKERSRLEQIINELNKGDKVLLRSGIIGRVEIINKEQSTFVINSEGSKFLITKDAIMGLANES